jgi:hypothetical protein
VVRASFASKSLIASRRRARGRGPAWVAPAQVAPADSGRDPVVVSVERAFAPVGLRVPAARHAAATIGAPVPTTSEPVVVPTVLAAAPRPVATRRSSRGVRRT